MPETVVFCYFDSGSRKTRGFRIEEPQILRCPRKQRGALRLESIGHRNGKVLYAFYFKGVCIIFALPSHSVEWMADQEHMIVMDSSQKPLIFFHIVHTYNVRNALVFTKSAESTIRLVRLLDFFEIERTRSSDFLPLVVRAYSSDLPVQERKTILEQFRNQKINMSVGSSTNIDRH